MELALGMALKLYTNVAKGLKLKAREFWVLILTFVEVTEKKQLGGDFLLPRPEYKTMKQRMIENY